MFKKYIFSALMAAALALPGKAAVKEPVDYVHQSSACADIRHSAVA